MLPVASLLRTLAADSLLVLTVKVLSLPLGYYTLVLLARLYGAEAMGTYTLAAYLMATLAVLCRLGLDTGILRFFSALGRQGGRGSLMGLLRPSLLLVAGLSSVAGFGLWAGQAWLAGRFQAPQLPSLLVWTPVLLPLAAVSGVLGEALRALGGVRWMVITQDGLFPAVLLGLLLSLAGVAATLGNPAWVLGLALFGSHLLAAMGLAVGLAGRLLARPAGGCPGSGAALLRYSFPLFLSAVLMLAYGSLDSLILGWFQPPQQVAYFESAARTALLVSLPLIAVNAVAPPFFSRLHAQGELPLLEALARASARWAYYLALPLTLGCLLLAPEILGWFGSGFQEGCWALRLLALAQLVNVASGSVGILLAMTGHQIVLTRVLALAGLGGLPLMALAAAGWGLTGLAAAKALWLVAVNLLLSLAVWRCLGIKVFAMDLLPAHRGGLLAVFSAWLVLKPGGAVAAALLFALVYLASVARPLVHEFGALTHPALEEGAL